MTDAELLELAAKVAGVDGQLRRIQKAYSSEYYLGIGKNRWNPLDSDADAFRLAVRLEMSLDLTIATQPFADVQANKINVHCDGDPYAAARRAITLAAVEIGKGL